MSAPTVKSLAKPVTALMVAAGALAAGKPLGSATTTEVAGYVTAAVGALVATHPAVKKTVKTAATKAAKTVTPKPKAKTPAARFAMYDSVDVDQIPGNATHVAGYVNGKWPTVAALRARFPHAKVLTIAVTANADAECLDVETGDATPAQAPAWVKRQQARGVKHPKIYANRSTMPTVWAALQAAGIKRDEVKLWVADWTGQPHLPAGYDACQWISTAGYDESLCGAHFLA